MDKDHLLRLQAKVKKLMHAESEDSDSDDQLPPHSPKVERSGDNPDTVRKCITLINQNRQLKTELQKEKKKNEKITRELLKARQEKDQLDQYIRGKMTEFQQTKKIDSESLKKNVKVEVELTEWRKKCKQLDELLKLERRKCHKLSNFIRKEMPKLHETITVLTTKVDSKLESHLLKQFDI